MKETLVRVLYGICGMAFGVLITVKANKIVDNIGRISYAEKYLGVGGSYTFMRLLGILLVFIFLALATGTLGLVFDSIKNFLLSIFSTL